MVFASWNTVSQDFEYHAQMAWIVVSWELNTLAKNAKIIAVYFD